MTIKKPGRIKAEIYLAGFFILFAAYCADAQIKLAVLVFELKDLTLLPGTPEELARTASVKPMLEAALAKAGYGIVQVPTEAQAKADSGAGYLYDHHDAAGTLGKAYGADYVMVGRLHKPSFLFVYLMVHVVEVKSGRLVADIVTEVKGGDKRLTGKGVNNLAVKIAETLNNSQ